MEPIAVDWRGGDEYAISVRNHTLTVDQPVGGGGADIGPTPTELFIAGLASCVAFYAGRYLARHKLPGEGLRVLASYTMSTDRPARVGRIDLQVELPEGVPEERRPALLAMATHCTVHNSITHTPEINVALAEAAEAADQASPWGERHDEEAAGTRGRNRWHHGGEQATPSARSERMEDQRS